MRRTSTSFIGIGALAFVALGEGCGPQYRDAFGHHFLDNQEADLAVVMARLPEPSRDDGPQNALGQPIVVATTHAEDDEQRRMVAFRVDTGEQLWSVDVNAATQPEILGDVVLTSTRERLLAYDLASGRELWHRDLPDLAYVGATRDGNTICWSATVGALGGARRVGHVVAMDARSGSDRWRHEVQGVFGQPAASGGLVFVPWERQNIAILDEETGVELARLRSTDDVVAWAFDHPTGIYYGGRGMYRLTHRSASGTREEATHLRPPLGELPRQPESIWPDGFLPKPGTRSARGRIRVYFNPAPAEDPDAIHIEGETYYFTYYRYVFAYDLEGNLRWTRILEQDVINAEVMPHGLLAVGEQGQLRLLDRDTGSDRWTHDLAMPLASVALDATGFLPEGESGEARPLRQALNEMALDPDNRLVAARSYAVQQLARLEEDEITRDLLDLYQQRSMPGAVKETIREALRARESGAQYLMEALTRRYDYLENTEAPPLEAIVPALLAMEHREAVPSLINHMLDHETPAEVLPEVVRAVVTLGGEEVIPALRNFLVLYHADSEFDGPVADQEPEEEGGEPVRAVPEAQALAIAAAGIFEHGGDEGRELLSSLSSEGARTHEPISDHIASLYEAERRAEEQRRREEEEAAQAALAEAARQAEEALPSRLTQDAINSTFAENADSIRECIAAELERNPQLMQVRLLFILSGDGSASDLTVAPNSDELLSCLQEQVAAIEFPRFRQRRMRGSFLVSIRGNASNAEDAQPAVQELPEGAPWWAWSQMRAEQHGPTALPALASWWSERDAPVQAQPTQPVIAVPEHECPPGMPNCSHAVASNGRTGSSDSQPTNATEGGDRGSEPGADAGGEDSEGSTPWWAGAAGEEEESGD